MPIRLECHGCGQELCVDDHQSAGGKVQCPCCPYIMDVPDRAKGDARVSDAAGSQDRPGRPRRRSGKQAQSTQEAFDAMDTPQEPALMRALDGLMLLHPVVLFLLPGIFVPVAIIVMIVSNDREATRNAVLVLFFALIHLMLTVWILIVYKSVDALY